MLITIEVTRRDGDDQPDRSLAQAAPPTYPKVLDAQAARRGRGTAVIVLSHCRILVGK